MRKPLDLSQPTEADTLGRALMLEVMLDNGAINAMEPDEPSRYPAKHLAAIGAAAKVFFDRYPDLLDNDAIFALGTGDASYFRGVPGVTSDDTNLDTSTNPFWCPLRDALDAYFNDGL